GLVFRRQSKGDRRATLLTSSAKGRRLVEKYENLQAERLAPVLKAFNAEELDQLAHLLERFSLVLIHAEDSGEGLCFRCSAYFEDECPVTHLREGCPYQKVRGPRVPATGEMEA
ncbi:MAG: MarR family winged helix-turn-helix transcriptional regulator, partial [Thermoanaerobaculia bacterium]